MNSATKRLLDWYTDRATRPVCTHTWSDFINGLAEECPNKPHHYQGDREYAEEMLQRIQRLNQEE